MKYDELNKYIVKCKMEADMYENQGHPSGFGDCLLSDYKHELKELFDTSEDVSIIFVEDFLKSMYSYIISIKPVD